MGVVAAESENAGGEQRRLQRAGESSGFTEGRARGRQSPTAETRSESQCACQATCGSLLRFGAWEQGRAHAGLKMHASAATILP